MAPSPSKSRSGLLARYARYAAGYAGYIRVMTHYGHVIDEKSRQ